MYSQEKMSAEGGFLHLDLNASSLSEGMHRIQLQVITENGTVSGTYNGFFLRIPTQEEQRNYSCIYAVDDETESHKFDLTGNDGVYHFDLDMSGLSDGLHHISYFLSSDKGVSCSPQTRFFIKSPTGGNAIATVKLTAEDVEIKAGKTAEVTLSLENSMTIAGWQLYIYLPDDITLAYDEEDGERFYDDTVVLSSRHKRSHVCTVTETADGGWLIQGYNPSKPTAISGNSGELVTITLQASGDYAGQHDATIKGVAVAEIDNTQTDMVGEVTFQIQGPVPTGIHAITGDSKTDPVYNLRGQRVENPTKGIYVRRGQKVMKK
jgi:hypothetical protein